MKCDTQRLKEARDFRMGVVKMRADTDKLPAVPAMAQ